MDNKRLLSATKQAIYYRNYRRARDRAVVRLAQAHPDEYKAYLEEEKQNDYTQGKTWIDLDGNTNSSLDPNTHSLTSRGEGEPSQAEGPTRTGNL
jgi:hypothetical protein